ncbi:MAG: cobalamin B12-binding domain-containing protein [Elusimicrobia bacterium]|nr:cobalamin B12-binding domain-containing protein [Elusimicrobiota bacterium]
MFTEQKKTPAIQELIERAFCPAQGMTDILLIFPPTTVAERYGKNFIGDTGGDLPPLGISYIASYLREQGFGVGILDCPALGATFDEILEAVRHKNPRCIGISATTFAIPTSIKLSQRIRQEFPDKVIVLGGAHANAVPEHAMQNYDCFDLVVYGEGEITTRILLEELRRKDWNRDAFLRDVGTLTSIQGIVFKQDGKIVKTVERPIIMDLDSLPLPARDLLPVEKYIPLPNQYKRTPIAHMVVIRGCPFVCSFCDQAYTTARTTSPKRVIEEMEILVQNYGVREISFWDDTMTYNKRWMTEFCERLTAAKLDVIWSCYAAARTMNKDILKRMKESGCWNIFYGVETGHPELMKNIQVDKKNVDADLVRRVVQWTKNAGIEVRGSFMIALPGETPALAQETIRFAVELDPDYAQFSITTPFPGTPLYTEIKQGKWGKLTTEDFSQFQAWNVVFLPEGYKNKEEVWEMEKKAFRQFYFRPKFILKKMLGIRSVEDIRRYIKGFVALVYGFAFGPMPDHVRTKTGRSPQEPAQPLTPAGHA